MKNNSNALTKKPKPFIAPGSQIPVTPEELEKRQRRLERLEQIGEHPTRVTEEEYVNPYKLEAIVLINADKDVPEELMKKIEEFDKAHFVTLEDNS